METDITNLKFLIVDDNESQRKNLVNFLQDENISNIIDCGDGAEALAICEKEKLDFIICDLVLPTLDGFELLEKIANSDLIVDKPKTIVISSLKNASICSIESSKKFFNASKTFEKSQKLTK